VFPYGEIWLVFKGTVAAVPQREKMGKSDRERNDTFAVEASAIAVMIS
jgi:hypothetical protein